MYFAHLFVSLQRNMTKRREKAKPQKPEQNKQLMAESEQKSEVVGNQRKEKLADYLIDVSKYVLTGVVITSLFNDVTDKTIIYFIGMFVVVSSLWAGLRLTSKRKLK